MKKTFFLVLSAAMMSVASCGGNDPVSSATSSSSAPASSASSSSSAPASSSSSSSKATGFSSEQSEDETSEWSDDTEESSDETYESSDDTYESSEEFSSEESESSSSSESKSIMSSEEPGSSEHPTVNVDPADPEHGLKTQFQNIKELVYHGFQVQEEEQAEGTVLLKNDNNALPLARGSKVSLFGNASVDPFYGASGSGGINTSEKIDWYDAFAGKAHTDPENPKNLVEGDVIFQTNDTLKGNYNTWKNDRNKGAAASSSKSKVNIGDVAWEEIAASEGGAAIPEYGDAAIMIIKRTGGEDYDLPATSGRNAAYGNENNADACVNINDGHLGDYLQLNDNEMSILAGLKALKAEGKVKKIVLILNMASTIKLDFLKNNVYDIDAALWAGSVGEVGTVAVAKLLAGVYNFSAANASTLWMDHLLNPTNNNYADTNYYFKYENYADFGFDNPALTSQYTSSMHTYSVYQEGMYLGYKYTETRYEDYVMQTPKAGEFKYDDVVAYPFGYGKSYTSFEMSEPALTRVGKDYRVYVTVKNTGEVAGKTPVQVYLAKPYGEYAKRNQIQVPSVELIDFGKTKLLAPGESQRLAITVREKYFATYDTFGKGTYVIMSGDYYLLPAFNAHEAVNNLLAVKGFNPVSTANRMDAEGDAEKALRVNYAGLDATTYAVSEVTGKAIGNLFGFADINTYSGRGNNSVKYYSRDDWEAVPMLSRSEEGVLTKHPAVLTMTQQMANELRDQMDASKVITEGGDYPTYGADNGLKLIDLYNEPYDSPKWDQLLDQLSWNDSVKLVSNGRHKTIDIASIDKPGTGDENGPNGFSQTIQKARKAGNYNGPTNPYAERIADADLGNKYTTTGFSSNGVLAATFNKEIAEKVGKQIGEEGYWAGMAGLLGGGFNILRSPYEGRTAEYYSEDAILTGLIGAPETAAIESMGIHCFVKHCALNESETGRHGVQEWITEQAFRENYLRAFEIVFIDGGAWNTMTAFNRYGTIAAANCVEFGRGWLRDEIGMKGIVETDAAGDMTDGKHGEAYVSRICNVFTGATDLNEYNYADDAPDYTGSTYTYANFAPTSEGGEGKYGNLGKAMREACKRICYSTLYSNAMGGKVKVPNE